MYKRIEYIRNDPLPNKRKWAFLMRKIKGIKTISPPTIWHEDLVCVIVNREFDEARYVSNQFELEIIQLDTIKQKHWLIIPNAKQYL